MYEKFQKHGTLMALKHFIKKLNNKNKVFIAKAKCTYIL